MLRRISILMAAAAIGTIPTAALARDWGHDRDDFRRGHEWRHDDDRHDGGHIDIRIGGGSYCAPPPPVCPPPPPVCEERVWVPAVYRTVCDRRWVEPVYRTVVDRVWIEPVTQ